MSCREPRKEDFHSYAAGRGRRRIEYTQVMPPNKKFKPKNPRLCIVRVPANPEDFTIVLYLNEHDNYTHKRIMMNPEKQILTHDQIIRMTAGLIALNAENTKAPTFLQAPHTYNLGSRYKYPVFLSQELRSETKRQFRRIQKWRRKNS